MTIETQLDLLSAAIFAAVGGVVFVATLRRPIDAIVALLATAPFDFSHYLGPTTITFGKVALVAAILALAVRRPDLRIFSRGAPRALAIAIVAVLCATALSAVVAYDRGTVLRETLKALQYLLTFAVAALAWSLDPDRRRLLWTITIAAAAVAILALAQEVTGAPSGIWYNDKAYPRIAGPLEGPNQLAGYLGIALPFVLVLALESATWPVLATIVVITAALVLTLSRAGLAAAFVAVAIVLVLRGARAPVLAALGIGAGAAAALVLAVWHLGEVGTRFISVAEVPHSGGVGTRSILWRAAIALWQKHPLLGVGAGNFELLLPGVAPAGIRTHANSWYLQSLVEGGIPLFGATLGLVWASIAPFVRALRNDLCLAAFAASVAFALHGILDLLIFYPKIALPWFVVLGVAAVERDKA